MATLQINAPRRDPNGASAAPPSTLPPPSAEVRVASAAVRPAAPTQSQLATTAAAGLPARWQQRQRTNLQQRQQLQQQQQQREQQTQQQQSGRSTAEGSAAIAALASNRRVAATAAAAAMIATAQQQRQQQRHSGSGRSSLWRRQRQPGGGGGDWTARVLQRCRCWHSSGRQWRRPAAMALLLWMIAAMLMTSSIVSAAQRDAAKTTKDLMGGAAAAAGGSNVNAIPGAAVAPAGNGNAATSGGAAHVNSNNKNNNNSSGALTTLTMTTTTTTVATATTTAAAGGGFAASLAKSGGGSSSSSSSLPKGLGSASGVSRNAIEQLEEDVRNGDGPFFDLAASKNVTALLGKTAYLNCRVKNLGNKTMLMQVSWVRHRDIHLLTVGRYTYTSDQRFRAIHQPQTDDWVLQIKYPQHRDSGIYECQVSTTPHMSHHIHLTVVEPATEIIGAPDLYIESGSTINLTCVILNSPEPPAYIFWNHNSAIINYDSPRGGVSVVTNKGDTTTSFLLIKSARPSDSGHYQCNPSNSKPKSVTVHVLNGEYPAAMQRAAPSTLQRMSPTQLLSVYLFICYCSWSYARRSMRPSSASAVAAN